MRDFRFSSFDLQSGDDQILLRDRPDIRHSTFDIRPSGFTLIELLIVVLIIAVAAALAVPQMGQTAATRLRQAVLLLAADLGQTQIESITHSDDPRLIVFDTEHHRYHVAAASDPDTPITNPVGKLPYEVAFGIGRAQGLTGLTIADLDVGDDDQLAFGIYGQLDQADDATITLACEGLAATVTIEASTGDVTVE